VANKLHTSPLELHAKFPHF